MSRTAIIVAVAGACAVASLTAVAPARADDEPASGKRLTPFVLKDASGQAYDVGQHIGRDVVVMAFWATWCKPCKLELAALHQIYRRYMDKGLVVLAISIDGPDSIAEVNNYRRKYSYTFPVLLDSETALLERYNPRGDIPFSMVVDRNGVIVETHQGFNPGDEGPLEVELLHLLEQEAERSGEGTEAPASAPQGYWRIGTPHVEGTESLQLRYLIDNDNGRDTDDGVFGIINKLTIGAAGGPLSLGVRSDNIFYPGYDHNEECAGTDLSNCQWRDDNRIERVWLQYKNPILDVRAGDFYNSIGRGLVFSARKIDELGLDTALRGGRARGTIGPVTLHGFGGVSNIQNVDISDKGFIDEREDKLVGGEIIVDLPLRMTVAVRGLYADYEEKEGDPFDEGDWLVGGSFEARDIADMVSVYLEGAYIENLKTSNISGRSRDREGYAVYGSVSVNPLEGLAFLLEVRDYRSFLVANPDQSIPVAYHESPSMERFDQITPTNSNNTGGRLLAEYYIKPIGMLVFVNALWYGFSVEENSDHEELTDTFGEDAFTALHVYGGIEKRWTSGYYLNVSAGWRQEVPNSISAGDTEFRRRLWHVETDVQVPLVGKHSLGLRTNFRMEDKELKPSFKSFMRGDAALTYGFAPVLTMGLLWTFQTEDDTREEWLNLAGEVVWRFSDWGQISVFAGRNTGGIICVSGVCRDFPPFFGVRSELVARF